LKKFAKEKIQYITGIKNIAASTMVINVADMTLLFNLVSKYKLKEFVATARSRATNIAFKNGLKSSTIKKTVTVAIKIKK